MLTDEPGCDQEHQERILAYHEVKAQEQQSKDSESCQEHAEFDLKESVVSEVDKSSTWSECLVVSHTTGVNLVCPVAFLRRLHRILMCWSSRVCRILFLSLGVAQNSCSGHSH